jgi:hypothetical protein
VQDVAHGAVSESASRLSEALSGWL